MFWWLRTFLKLRIKSIKLISIVTISIVATGFGVDRVWSQETSFSPNSQPSDSFLTPDELIGQQRKTDEELDLELFPVNSISDLSDVSPTDWAYSALQGLIERYNCLLANQSGRFRGKNALTRYEFAASLNHCLNVIQEMLSQRVADSITRDDLLVVNRLQEEFAVELGVLRSRIDTLESRTAELEANQFSPTTKLSGVVNFVGFGPLSGDGDHVAVLQQRIRILFSTSFTGKDLLVTRFVSGNSQVSQLENGTPEQTLSHQWYGFFPNRAIGTATLYYMFPITDKLVGLATPVGGLHADYAFPSVNPYFEDFDQGTTTLSPFGQRNPILRLGGGTGGAFVYFINPQLSIGAGAYAGEGFNPEEKKGLFNGSYSAGATLRWQPRPDLGFGLSYIHAYFRTGQFGFDDNGKTYGAPAVVGTGLMTNTLAEDPVVANAYGAEVSWRVSPKFNLGAWGGLTKVRAIGSGDGDIWTYAVTMAFPDLGKNGNLGGIIVGSQPYLADFDHAPENFTNDVPIHVEAFYRYQVNDFVSVTPGFVWNTAPNQNADNEDIFMWVLRTTFLF